MTTRVRIALGALSASLLMALAVSSASANNLAVSSETAHIAWPLLILSSGEQGEGIIIECPVTLSATFHETTIAKTEGTLIGNVTEASVDNGACVGGHATILTETLPWNITYQGFQGELPNIEALNLALHGTAFKIEVIGVQCLYADDGSHAAQGEATVNAAGQVTELSSPGRSLIPKNEGSIFCPGQGYFSGEAPLTELGGEPLFIELI